MPATATNKRASPQQFFTWTEPVRALSEFALLPSALPLLNQCPRGDGHRVLVLPGFMASDTSTTVLRRFLSELGYDVTGWQLGRNIGPKAEIVEQMKAHVRELSSGNTKISIVGQSLGGVYAREIARRYPRRLRQIITLGSPIAGSGSSNTFVRSLFDSFNQEVSGKALEDEFIQAIRQPLKVPCSALYSRADGIVHWKSCMQATLGPRAENLEVYGSHCGMSANALVLYAVADRLAQPQGQWQPFNPGLPISLLYPFGEGHTTQASA